MFTLDLYVNADDRILVDSAGNPLSSADVPQFFREETALLRFHVVDRNNNPWPFLGDEAFEFGADPDFDQATAVDLLSEDDQFNLPGDWDDMDPLLGLICCRVRTNTTEFNTALGTGETLDSGCYLKVCTDVLNNAWATVFDHACIYRNIRRANSDVPEEVTGPEYLTAAQTAALMDSHEPDTAKGTPADADRLTLWDSAAGLVRKYLTWANLKTALASVFAAIDHGHDTLLSTAAKAALTGGAASDADSLHTHSSLAAADHDHDADYAAIDHTHDADYAAIDHTHDADYAAIDHTHDADYAAIDHTHATLLSIDQKATLTGGGNADELHTHAGTGADSVTTPAGTTVLGKVYRRTADGWQTADPDDMACETGLLWIAQGTNASDGMRAEAVVTNPAWSWAGIPDTAVWMSDDGAITETKPNATSHAGRVARQVGWVESATSIRFNGKLQSVFYEGGVS